MLTDSEAKFMLECEEPEAEFIQAVDGFKVLW